MVNLTKVYFFGYLLIPLIVSNKNKLKINEVNKFIIYTTFALSSLGIIQYLVPSSYYIFVLDMSEYGFGEVVETGTNRRVVGLALSPTHYGNLMTLLLLYSIGVRKSVNVSKYIIFSGIIIGVLVIVITGIKTSLATLLLGIFILGFLKKDRALIKFMSIACIILFFSWNIIIGIGGGYSHDEAFSNPIGRSLRLFSLVSSNEVGADSTLKLTLLAFDDFLKAPFIGSGDRMDWLRIYSLTDAYLLFHLVQFGIIGMLIFFYPYLNFIKKLKVQSEYVTVLTVFIIIILQTLTDPGIFYNPSNMFLCIIIGIQIKESKSLSTLNQ